MIEKLINEVGDFLKVIQVREKGQEKESILTVIFNTSSPVIAIIKFLNGVNNCWKFYHKTSN